MKILALAAAMIAGLLVVAAAAFLIYGRAETWTLLTGPNDLGPYDFSAAHRRSGGNDALACSPGLCARPDFELPTFPQSPDDLVRMLGDRLDGIDPHARRVDDGRVPGYARFLTFSPLMRFPDTIDIRAKGLADGRTAVMAYSRSKLGSKDFGKNREHIERLFRAGEPHG